MTKYIDADALYKRLSVFYNPETGIKAFNAAITLAKELVKNADAADVEPVVRATWQDGKCTNCGCYGFPTYDGGNERTAHCPFCGAHMERSGSK